MKKAVLCVGIFLLMGAIFAAIPGLAHAENVPGTVEGEGTFFEVTDSEYLNVTLESTEPVKLYMGSYPETIRMVIEALTGAQTTEVILSGLTPGATYYKYEDEFSEPVELTAGVDGVYHYTQDISSPHSVSIETQLITPEDEEASPPWIAKGEGTHFTITESDYLDVTLDSVEIVKLRMESAGGVITIQFAPATSALSSDITIGGLLPNTVYYKYEDNFHNLVEFTSDAGGGYSYPQDLGVAHVVFIKTEPSTKFIRDDATGGDCSEIGVWDPDTLVCTLMADVFETIQIDSDGITLDGSGHLLKGGSQTAGIGVYAENRNDVTVQNFMIETFAYGIYFYKGRRNTIQGNTISDIRYGIFVKGRSARSTTDFIIFDNTVNLNGSNYARDAIHVEVSDEIVISKNNITGQKIYWSDHFGGWSDCGIYAYATCADITNNVIENFGYGLIGDSTHMCQHRNTGSGTYQSLVIKHNLIANTVYGLRTNGNWGRNYFEYNTISDSKTAYYSGYADDYAVTNNNFLRNQTQVYNYPYYNEYGYVSYNHYDSYDTEAEGCYDANSNGYCDAPFTFPGHPTGNKDLYPRISPVTDAEPLTYDLPPVARANWNRSITARCEGPGGAQVYLASTGSYSPDGDPLIFAWTGPFGTVNGAEVSVTIPNGTYSVTLTATELGGLSASASISVSVYDPSPPDVSIAFSGTQDPDGMYTSDVLVTLTGEDHCTGVRDIHYVLNGVETVVTGSSASFILSASGTYTVGYWAVDNSDNAGFPPAEFTLAMGVIRTAAGPVERLSVDSDENQANRDGHSDAASVSADGRYVAFHSIADNLVPDDTNGAYDVFVRDRETGTTERVSVDSSGLESNGNCMNPAISGDGRYVAFESYATNLVPSDTSARVTVLLHDRLMGETRRVDIGSNGNLPSKWYYYSQLPSISSDGRFITFYGYSDIVPGYPYGIFVHDRDADTNGVFDEPGGIAVYYASKDSSGTDYGAWGKSDISDNGRYVAFQSLNALVPDDTNGRYDVFVHDMQTGATERVSVASDGAQGNDESRSMSISADGRYVAFESRATNLVDGDTNYTRDVFVRDRLTGTTTRASVDSAGAQGSGTSPSMSGDGSSVVFVSGSALVAGDTNGKNDIFIRNLLTGATERLSVGPDGIEGDGNSSSPSISADATYVVFTSAAATLVPNDTNEATDIFGFDRSNQPPVADAGPDQTVECTDYNDTPVTLDGSGSFDPDGDVLTYMWTPFDPPAGGAGPEVMMPYGSSTVTLTVNDGKADSDPDTVDITVADTTAPVTTHSIDGTMGDNGWYVSDITVTLVATDGCTGVKEIHYRIDTDGQTGQEQVVPGAGATFTIDTDGVHTVVYWAVDNAGVAGNETTAPVQRETAPPVTTPTVPTTPPGGYYNDCIDVLLSAEAGSSGAAVTQYSFDGSTWYDYTDQIPVCNEGDTDVYYRSKSNAGNEETPKTITIKIDTTPPVTSYTLSGTLGSNGWYISDVTVTLTAMDATSGVAEIHYVLDGEESVVSGDTASFTVSTDGAHAFTYWAKDAAGNTETPQGPMNFKIDTTPPVTTHLLNGTMGANDWYVSDVAVTLTAVDAGSGVAEIHYVLDGVETVVPGDTASFTVSADGAHSLTYWAKDVAGNAEAERVPVGFMIDQTPPVTAYTLSGTLGSNGWYISDVTVTLTAMDATSGVAEIHYVLDGVESVVSGDTASFIVSTDGAHAFTYWAKDAAGNTEAQQGSVDFKIDATPPVITISGVTEGAKYPACSPPTPTYTADDATSGPATHSATLEGGNANGVGTFTYTVTATDNAGNTATESVTYKLVYAFDGFQTPVTLDRPFRQGSTIPVKFVLTDGCGAYVTNATATLSQVQLTGSEPLGDPIDSSTNVPDSGNIFRYVLTDNHYIYNLATDGLSVGEWRATVTLDDGETYSVDIGVK